MLTDAGSVAVAASPAPLAGNEGLPGILPRRNQSPASREPRERLRRADSPAGLRVPAILLRQKRSRPAPPGPTTWRCASAESTESRSPVLGDSAAAEPAAGARSAPHRALVSQRVDPFGALRPPPAFQPPWRPPSARRAKRTDHSKRGPPDTTADCWLSLSSDDLRALCGSNPPPDLANHRPRSPSQGAPPSEALEAPSTSATSPTRASRRAAEPLSEPSRRPWVAPKYGRERVPHLTDLQMRRNRMGSDMNRIPTSIVGNKGLSVAGVMGKDLHRSNA